MKRNFTLTEMLVVIAIIGILAGMAMPALLYARESGQRTKCLNNKANIIKAMQIYANKNEELVPYMLGGNSYAYIMVGGKERDYKTKYLSGHMMTCTVYKEDYETGSNGNDAEINNAVGMLNVNDDTWTGDWKGQDKNDEDGSVTINEKFGRFTVKADDKNIAYSFVRMKSPGQLPILADSFLQITSQNPYPTAIWNFLLWNKASGNSTGFISTVHGDLTTMAFADGSARALSARELASFCGVKHTLDTNLDTVKESL